MKAVQREVARCYERPALSQSRADKIKIARGDPDLVGSKCDIRRSIFALRFLVAIIDEIHLIRNLNMLYIGLLTLMTNAHIRIGATATPIYTGPKVSAHAPLFVPVPNVSNPTPHRTSPFKVGCSDTDR